MGGIISNRSRDIRVSDVPGKATPKPQDYEPGDLVDFNLISSTVYKDGVMRIFEKETCIKTQLRKRDFLIERIFDFKKL